MSDILFDMPWRKNYEAIAIAGWLMAAAVAWFLPGLSQMPPTMFYYFTAASLAMAMYRLPDAWRLRRRHRALAGQPLTFLDADKLVPMMKKHPDSQWWGHGFDWTKPIAQQAYYFLRNDMSAYVPLDRSGFGWRWMHGLSVKEEALFQPLGHSEGHTLIVGTTGAGKTRMFDLLVTQAVLRGEAVVIVDPKGDKDLQRTARRACALAGKPQRFVYLHPAFPERSHRLNPLQNFTRPTEVASRVAALVPSETGADPFKAFGQMALNNVVQGLVATNQRPSLVLLRRYLEGGPEKLVFQALERYCADNSPDWKAGKSAVRAASDTTAKAEAVIHHYREVVQDTAPSPDLEGLIAMFEHERAHFGKMIASLMPVLNMLTSGEIGPLLSPDPLDMDDPRPITDTRRVINDGQVAYLGLDSLTDPMVGSALGSMFLSDLTAVAGDRYNFGVKPRIVNIFVDEAAEVVNDPFIQLLNKGRGARVRLFVATQTFADFVARTGSDAKARQILGNINNIVALRVMDAETQEYVVEALPKTHIAHIMQTHGVSTHSQNPGMFAGNHGERLMEEEAELFPAALLGELPNLEYIGKFAGGRIVKGRLPIITSKLDDEMPALPEVHRHAV